MSSRTCGAGGSIKPGAQAPGSKQEKRIEPAERAAAFTIALSPASRAQFVLLMANLGLAPQALFCRPLRGLGVQPLRGLGVPTAAGLAPTGFADLDPTTFKPTLLRRAGRIVYHKRSCQRRILHAKEVDPNRLPLKRSQIESLQCVPSRLVQV